MPGDRDDEICQKALELLSDLCSKGEVQNDNCLDFIYYFRDLARPRYTDSGEASFDSNITLNSEKGRLLSLNSLRLTFVFFQQPSSVLKFGKPAPFPLII